MRFVNFALKGIYIYIYKKGFVNLIIAIFFPSCKYKIAFQNYL